MRIYLNSCSDQYCLTSEVEGVEREDKYEKRYQCLDILIEIATLFTVLMHRNYDIAGGKK